MDLFVINRYTDAAEDDIIDRETVNLQRLKQKIEERKKRNVQKKVEEISLKPVETFVEEVKIEEIKEPPKDTEEIPLPEKVKPKITSEFKVLGGEEVQKKITVKRILPYWLSHPTEVSVKLKNLTCKVEEQSWLCKTLQSTLISDNITHLFPVQEQVIPFILKQHKLPHPFWPQDICVSAPTGSGKTLSFVLPIIQVLLDSIGHHVRALVVLPVQELASQVAKVFKKYASKTNLKVALLSGSTPLRQEQKHIMQYTETMGWMCQVDIIVCTAGRLVEHLQNTEGFSLKHLKFLVIDEADRIMDHIQNDWLYHLDKYIKLETEVMTGKVQCSSWNRLNCLKRAPHKLLFSATLSHDPEKLQQWNLFQPKLFSVVQKPDSKNSLDVKKYTTPDELLEKFVICEAEEKPLILYHLLVEKKWNRVLCFTNSAQTAHRLSVLLNTWADGKLKVAELSAALDRMTRETVLRKFQQAEIDVLIGTDALARGIDVQNCDYVISYDPPRNIKTYVHRIGRTGRAGRDGCAVTILQNNQVNIFKETLQLGGEKTLPQIELPKNLYECYSEGYEQAINTTKNLIQEENVNKVKKSVALKRGPKSRNTKRKTEFQDDTNKRRKKE